jgi:hypothetical protein
LNLLQYEVMYSWGTAGRERFTSIDANLLSIRSRSADAHQEMPRAAAVIPALTYLSAGGTAPPLAANFAITSLCSQMFMLAESAVSPV